MKRVFTNLMLLALMVIGGSNAAWALESYDFQELCMKLGKGGPWAVNDGGDAGFTIGDATMHFLGDYTEQGFSWNQRFAYEYVDGRGKFTMRNKNNKKDSNCGMFSWDYSHKFSILGLKDGDKVTITIGTGTVTFVSTNVTAEVNEGDNVASKQAYTIATADETTRLDIQMALATLISKIEIEPYGVETIPVITVTPKTLKLIPGATSKLKVDVSPAADSKWSSADENVATVAEDGTVTAVAAGTATIINMWRSEISDAMSQDACEVTVADVDLSAYDIVKAYDFTTMGDVTLEINTENVAGSFYNAANNKNNNAYWCTNEGLDFLAVQAVADARNGRGWLIDNQLENYGGLYMGFGAGRCAAIGGIKAGQIVEFIYTGNGFYTKSDGSDDGIEKDALNEGTGRAIYLAKEDGMIGFELDKGNAVQKINIYEITKEDVYTVAGTMDLTGYVWDERQNEMSYDAETGLYTWTAENITVTAEVQPEFKVVKNGTEWYPAQDETGDNNWVITPDVVGGEGIYTITITFDPNAESDKISVTGVKTGEITIYIYTAKFINTKDWSKVCVWAWNGSVNLYEAWPGVEATKTEEQVDGHDVYAWSYTGVIEPTMIIFNNGDNGEQTGDLEFVNGATYNADGIVPAGPTVATFDFADPNFRENIGEAMADTKGFIYNETFYADGTSLQITAGSAPSRIYKDANRGQCLVIYNNYGSMVFKAPFGLVITKIEFTAAGTSNINKLTPSSGAIEGMTWTGNAEGVRFIQGGTTYLANVIVTMEAVNEESIGLEAIEYTSCDNIAAFNALDAGTFATVYLNDAEVIGKSADGYSTVWIQDATGGCWIQYTSLNDQLQEKTKVNGHVNVVKRDASGNPQMKEAEGTLNPYIFTEDISNYTTAKGTIAEVNVAENLNKVVKISGAMLEMTSATAGKLTQGDVTIDVNNGPATANQQLCKIADWEKDTKLENIVITAILVANSATDASKKQLLPISIQPVHTDYYLVGSMSSWSPNKDYTLVINDKADAEEYMITCNLEEGTEMKVARSENGTTIADTDWYPTGVNNNYYISETANYTVYFRPNYDGGDAWHEKVLYVVNNGPATGIGSITAEKLQNATIYNLNGQRMQNNTQKGLYIVNGKKVIK